MKDVDLFKESYSVGILGAGTVGGGLVRLIQKRLSQWCLPLAIKKVGVRDLSKSRSLNLPDSVISDDLTSIVKDPSIDIVVEAIGGLEPARTYIEEALNRGKHVVTANKYVISESGDRLLEVAAARKRHFLYEASVAGSIPIIKILKEALLPDKVSAIYAILNGTSNFVLTRMTESAESYQTALVAAQEQGFSEADPSFDISGRDAAQKLAILVSILRQKPPGPALSEVRGINSVTPWDIKFAASRAWVVKPLAIYEEFQGAGFASVEPVLVSSTSVLASVRNEYNALCFDYPHIGRQVFIGKGAGELPTASAIYSDLRKITLFPEGPPVGDRLDFASGQTFQFLPSLENPRPYSFYVRTSFTKNKRTSDRIQTTLDSWTEGAVEGPTSGPDALRMLSIVTRPIPQSELFKLLDLIISLDDQAQFCWLRIREDP